MEILLEYNQLADRLIFVGVARSHRFQGGKKRAMSI
jgi:hypothetical protein